MCTLMSLSLACGVLSQGIRGYSCSTPSLIPNNHQNKQRKQLHDEYLIFIKGTVYCNEMINS